MWRGPVSIERAELVTSDKHQRPKKARDHCRTVHCKPTRLEFLGNPVVADPARRSLP